MLHLRIQSFDFFFAGANPGKAGMLARLRSQKGRLVQAGDRTAEHADTISPIGADCGLPVSVIRNAAQYTGQSLIGKNIGDTFDINVTFPTDYRISTMQNRSVVFHTTLKKIRLMDYQPIDDEFAKDFSEYTTLNEWENEIFSHLQARRKTSVQEKLTREVMTKIIADSDIPIDDDMKEEITQIYYDDFLDELEMNQIPLELYCKRSGHTEDEIYADKEQEAIKTIQAQSVLHAVAAAEKISITPEELAEELRAIAIEEDEDPEEFVETLEEEDVENIADQLTMDKTMAFILDSVIYDR